MLRELLKNKKILNRVNEILKNPEILDIILFGSSIRGKEDPKDIDLIILYSPRTKNIIKTSYKIKKELESINKINNFHLTSLDYNQFFNVEFLAREAILSEGFSLKRKKFVSESFGYKSFILFNYSLKNLNNSKRMQFYYSLYGRNQTGILEKNKSYKFSDAVIISPIENSDVIKSFFEKWKIKYIEFPIIIPNRIIKHVLKNS